MKIQVTSGPRQCVWDKFKWKGKNVCASNNPNIYVYQIHVFFKLWRHMTSAKTLPNLSEFHLISGFYRLIEISQFTWNTGFHHHFSDSWITIPSALWDPRWWAALVIISFLWLEACDISLANCVVNREGQMGIMKGIGGLAALSKTCGFQSFSYMIYIYIWTHLDQEVYRYV